MINPRTLGASKKPMRHDFKLLQYILMLRFGKVPDSESTEPILNYSSIAKLLRKPITTVIELIKAALVSIKYHEPEEAPSRSKFSHSHIAYLVSSKTL